MAFRQIGLTPSYRKQKPAGIARCTISAKSTQKGNLHGKFKRQKSGTPYPRRFRLNVRVRVVVSDIRIAFTST